VARYPNYYSYYYNDYEPTEIITDFYQGVPLDNESYAQNYPAYRSLVDLVLDKQIENLADTSLSVLEANLTVLKGIQSPTILQGRLNRALIYFTANEDKMEEMRDRMLTLAKSDKTREAITDHYAVISQLKPGNPSPSFDYENYAGGNTKLADLKGKYVYIDVWATWCGPCIIEIPHLKKIEAEFHDANIEFRTMIENRELGGTQLLADNDWNSDFIRNYSIRGIPRFILLDDQGKIVDADAERPSNPLLRERLQALGH